MKFLIPTLLLTLFANGSAYAAGSMLRITCEEADVGAEVIVNGKLRGECPVDVQVQAGKVYLKLIKAQKTANLQDEYHTAILVGEDTLKKVPVPPSTSSRWQIAYTKDVLIEKGRSFAANLKSAKSGDVEAMAKLAECYANGAGTPLNYGEAIAWYTKAADAGKTSAMISMGWMYYSPKYESGFTQDNEKSLFWMRKAVALGDKDAPSHLDALEQNINAKARLAKALAKKAELGID